ncbi:MAG: glutamine synthetase III [Lachnospiraceae bacterium]|nr:glutamine synthetase III [Lachnospiraceae bacterium]
MSEEVFKLSENFAKNVFNDAVMAEKLPSKTYKALKETIETGRELDREVANSVAHAMKEWAIERGATHFTHWFQPMTDITAEKHDSFITPVDGGRVIMSFSGKELIKGEPDASSFPSGGLRATFEARGYTSWDCTSPAFLKEDAGGVTLCIPTAFCSYTGEALDKKTPLLRSMEAIDREAVRFMKLFGYEDVKKVTCSVGAEQEYFLIDQEKFKKRPDLKYTGHTLFGNMPPKGQEMDDHYFGAIKERVAAFMKEVNEECWKLGILAKTQHNEAAPAQHELAPIYATANIATDHNQLIMEIMKKVAKRHGLECLLHEKPYRGVNGSGKHNNWSLVTDTGINMLDPGKVPHENTQFLLLLAAIIKAVDENAELIRIASSNPGNDYRLGADEAPPAIISVFLGDQLEDVVMQYINSGDADHSLQGGKMSIGVHTMAKFSKDATDRNRTSPFAFTGNKFELRMVASSLSVAGANTVLNTIVADALSGICDELERSTDLDADIHKMIAKILKEHSRVIFNGNGYSEEWKKEAEKRGLPNKKCMVDAVESLVYPHTVEIFEKFNVLSKVELEARAEINYETYAKSVNIEARTMIDMTTKQYIPAVIGYTKDLADSINSVKTAIPGVDVSVQTSILSEVSEYLKETKNALDALAKVTIDANLIEDAKTRAMSFKDNVVPAMAALRRPVDSLEMLVDKAKWPVPSYGDMMFDDV